MLKPDRPSGVEEVDTPLEISSLPPGLKGLKRKHWVRRGRWLRGRTFSSRERPLLLDRWSRALLPPHQYPRRDQGRGVMAWSWRGPYRILPLPCIRRSTTAIIHGCRIRKRCVIDLYCSFGYHPCSSTRTHVAVPPPLSPSRRFGIADCLDGHGSLDDHGRRIRKRCVIGLYCSFGYHPSSSQTHGLSPLPTTKLCHSRLSRWPCLPR